MYRKTTFATRLRVALEDAGMTQRELATALKINREGTVSAWVQDGGTLPSGQFMVQLPDVLGVSGHWLLTGKGAMRVFDDAPYRLEVIGRIASGDVTPEELDAHRRRSAFEVAERVAKTQPVVKPDRKNG